LANLPFLLDFWRTFGEDEFMFKVDEKSYHNGEVFLYKLKKDKKVSENWFYEIRLANQKRIRDRSTKIKDFNTALLYVESQYTKLTNRVNLGLPIATISMQQVVNEATAYYENRVKSGELAKERFNRFKRTMREIVIPFVNGLDKDFTELNSIDWEEYITYRKGKKQLSRGWHNKFKRNSQFVDLEVTNGSINMDLQMVRMVYHFAVKRELILSAQVPEIKSLKVKLKEVRRPSFTIDEWKQITDYMASKKYEEYITPQQHSFKKIYQYYHQLNRHLWLMLSQSTCRVGEIRELRFGNIEERKVKDEQTGKFVNRIIIDVTGKTGRRRVVCMPYASQTLMRWKTYLMNIGMTTNKTDYVYRHPPFTNKGKPHQPVHETNRAFQRMLKRIGLDKDAEGRVYSIYSIRHSAITWSLMRNVNLNAISKNSGVSIETLTRVYDHTQSEDYIAEIVKNNPVPELQS